MEQRGHEGETMEFQDRVLTCTTCGREFKFTAREQEFYQEKGFVEPKHCRECRQQRKMRREALAKEAPIGREPGTSRALFEVICAECGKRTQVPFKPLTGKPILCKDCFIQKRQDVEQGATGFVPIAEPRTMVPEEPADIVEKRDDEILPAIEESIGEDVTDEATVSEKKADETAEEEKKVESEVESIILDSNNKSVVEEESEPMKDSTEGNLPESESEGEEDVAKDDEK